MLRVMLARGGVRSAIPVINVRPVDFPISVWPLEHTRVVWRTLHSRGKSFTPESRVVIELSKI